MVHSRIPGRQFQPGGQVSRTAREGVIPDHDQAQRMLFSHLALLEDLITKELQASWTLFLDFSTLERVNAGSVTDRLLRREEDPIWRVRRKVRPEALAEGREEVTAHSCMSTESPGASPVGSEPRDLVAKIEAYSSTVGSCMCRAAGWNGPRHGHRPLDR
jgi:hypothetical protein